MVASSLRTVAVLGGLTLFAVPALAQGSWSMVTGGAVPPAASPVMVFDSARNVTQLVAFGGSLTMQVWERGSGPWSLRGTGSTGVNLRAHIAAAFDSGRGVTVVYAGGNTNNQGDELSEWNGSFWTNLSPLGTPRSRTKHAMAYDAARGLTVMVGGVGSSGVYGVALQDTWTWDGSSWAQRSPISFPAARGGHAMAYASARQRVILFGGSTGLPGGGGHALYQDTWEWDGATWIERTPASGSMPAARHEHSMAYDPSADLIYMFGGVDETGTPLNDLWAWNGTRWTQILAAAPARRWDAGMAFDSVGGRLTVFGGQNALVSSPYFSNLPTGPYFRDTWEYTPGIAGSFDAFGTGCAGTRGVPGLRASSGPPVAGQTFRVQLDNLPLTGPAFVFLGASNTLYGTLPLPFPLASIGMTGCDLRVSGDTLFQVQNILGTALWSVDVPLSAAGAVLYQQAFVWDPPANAAGLTVSPGARLQVGG